MTINPFYEIFDLVTSEIKDNYVTHVTLECGVYSIQVTVYFDDEDAIPVIQEKVSNLIEEKHVELTDKISFKKSVFTPTEDCPFQFYTLRITQDFE